MRVEMGKGLNDFLVKDPLGGFSIIDMDRVSKLPIEEFRKRYVEDMQTYLDSHPRPIVECGGCLEDIDSAADLIRRYGVNFHRECFKDVHEKERGKYNEYEEKYFDLVLASLNVDEA